MTVSFISQVARYVLNKINRPAGIHKTVILSTSQFDNNTVVGSCSWILDSRLYGTVQIGDHSVVRHSNISGDVKIGRYTSIDRCNIMEKINGIAIGNFCSIALNCNIQEFNHITDRCSTYYIFRNLIDAQNRQKCIWDGSEDKDIESKGTVVIGNDVWIGTQVIILSGVTIGSGAVIAANSTVTHNVPPYAVVGGTPARVLKYRFSREVIVKLLDLSWWDWDDESILEKKDLFSGSLSLDKLKYYSTV